LGDLRRLLAFLGLHWKRRVLVLAGMTLLGATAELLVIGSIVPFLAIIADPTGSQSGDFMREFLVALPRPAGMSTLSVVATIFIVFALGAAAIRLTLSRLTLKFVYTIGHEISVAIYERIVHQPYSFHIARNSSESVAAINRVVDLTHNMILPLVQCLSAGTIVVFIVTGLFIVDPVIAGSTILCFAIIYLVPSTFIRRRLLKNWSASGSRRCRRALAGFATCCSTTRSRSMSTSSPGSTSCSTIAAAKTCSWERLPASSWNRSASS
jgi:ABC-type multidrug transport system fused ATPase/permease subunit